MFPCIKDQEKSKCSKNESTLKSTEAQLWLDMMGSMLNFAMASTSLMKSIQNRVEVTRKLEEEARAMHAAEFFKQNLPKPPKENDMNSEVFSVKLDIDQCDSSCDGKKSPEPNEQVPCPKDRLTCQGNIKNLGDTCVCLKPPKEQNNEVKEDGPDIQVKDLEKEPSCVCLKGKREGAAVIEMGDDDFVCPADAEEQVESILPIDTEAPKLEETKVPDEEKVQDNEKVEENALNCGCQTTSSENLMLKELQMANLTYQMRQTDKNLKEMKKEMDRLTNVMEGKKKKCSFATAAALYEEIMKPTTALDEMSKFKSRKKRFS